MEETYNRPVALDDNINFCIWGDGDPKWGDPRIVCTRMFSRHIVWLCHKKPMSALEIAEELNVPTAYVEEELEILVKGENGKYGLLRRLGNGRYVLNFILFDKDVMEKANAIYTEQLPKICGVISDYIEAHKEEYLAYPYLNKKIDLNLVLWQQIYVMCNTFGKNVYQILVQKYFAGIEKERRPFSVYGYVDNGKYYGGGWNGVEAENVCGFAKIHLDNISTAYIQAHFGCGLNVASDPLIQLALCAIDGLDIASLSEIEKEHASKAVECGYLYREGDMLYTKILVSSGQSLKDGVNYNDGLFAISNRLSSGYFEKEAQVVAEKISELIHSVVPDALIGEWEFANDLAYLPIRDAVVEFLIEKGVLIPPKDGIGAEGCWMSVAK